MNALPLSRIFSNANGCYNRDGSMNNCWMTLVYNSSCSRACSYGHNVDRHASGSTNWRYSPCTWEEVHFSVLTGQLISRMTSFTLNLGCSIYWTPLIATWFGFILHANWLGASVPWNYIALPTGELAAPTNDINTNSALSLYSSHTKLLGHSERIRWCVFFEVSCTRRVSVAY